VKPFAKHIKEMSNLQSSLPCLKDQPDCPPEVERANVQLSPFAMCSLIMRNVSVQMEDEYNCIHNTVPTNPKKLVEQLTKIETKLSSSAVKVTTNADERKRQADDPQRSRSEKKRAKAEAAAKAGGKGLRHEPIPRKPFVKGQTSCKLCAEYGGASNTHKTAQCKKFIPGGKPHPEWKGGRTANINVHQGSDNQLMAQQLEFQKKMMKQMSKLSEKKKSKKKKRRRDSYSDSSSESD